MGDGGERMKVREKEKGKVEREKGNEKDGVTTIKIV